MSADDADSALDDALENLDTDDVPDDAGHFGTLVTARCISCKRVRLKRAPGDAVEGDRRTSFKHVCHSKGCRGTTWWNVLGTGGEARGN